MSTHESCTDLDRASISRVRGVISQPASEALVRDPIGQYPSATVACFDATCGDLPRRQLDADRNTRFLEKLARLGAPAVLIGASTGQGHLRTVDELREWFQIAAQASLGRTVRTALLRPEDGEEANGQLLNDLTRLNFPVIFVRPGTNLRPDSTDEQIAQNVGAVVSAAAVRGFAVGIYSIPDVSGVRLTAQAAAMLVQGPGGERIVAAKITESDYDRSTLEYLRHPALKRLKIVQGWDPHLTRALQDGPRFDDHGRQRCGITSGPMSFAVYQYLHLLEQIQLGHWEEVRAAQEAVTKLFQSMQDDPTKFANVQRAKYVMGLGQPLTGTILSEQAERILSALDTLPREDDRQRLAMSLNLMLDGPYRTRLNLLTCLDPHTPVAELRTAVAEFVRRRDWNQFHAPKNLSMALAIEAAELMEHFQWITADESRRVAEDAEETAKIAEELSDILCYTLALANELGVDLSSSMADKLWKNQAKYPAAEFRGRHGAEPKLPE